MFETNQQQNNANPNENLNKLSSQKNVVVIINELYPSAKYQCTETTDVFAAFKMTLEINGQVFVGTGNFVAHIHAVFGKYEAKIVI